MRKEESCYISSENTPAAIALHYKFIFTEAWRIWPKDYEIQQVRQKGSRTGDEESWAVT